MKIKITKSTQYFSNTLHLAFVFATYIFNVFGLLVLPFVEVVQVLVCLKRQNPSHWPPYFLTDTPSLCRIRRDIMWSAVYQLRDRSHCVLRVYVLLYT